VNLSDDILRLNVGFIIHEGIGYSRDFPFNFPKISVSPDLVVANLDGVVRVTRTAQGLLVQVNLSADAPAECVRCLVDFSQRLHVDYTDLYAFTRDDVTEAGLLVPETGKINLAPILREEMLLATPIRPLCRLDCKGLCPVCGENLNDSPHSHEITPSDQDAPVE
jgi:uncharacterized protein